MTQSGDLIARILVAPETPVPLAPTLCDLAAGGGRPDWSTLEEIGIPLHQSILPSINQAHYNHHIAEALKYYSLSLCPLHSPSCR